MIHLHISRERVVTKSIIDGGKNYKERERGYSWPQQKFMNKWSTLKLIYIELLVCVFKTFKLEYYFDHV